MSRRRVVQMLGLAAAVVAGALAWRFLSYYSDMRGFSLGDLPPDPHLAGTRGLWLLGTLLALATSVMTWTARRPLFIGAALGCALLAATIWLSPMHFGTVDQLIESPSRGLWSGLLAAAACLSLLATVISLRSRRDL